MSKVATPLLELKNICKTYPGVIALNGVSLSVLPGEVHALLGENGAGKSTLIKVCSGAISPTSGEIFFDGKHYDKMTPDLSIKAGIAVIYQEFNLVNALSVAENIFLGRALRKGIMIDRKAMNEKAAEIFKLLNVSIDPTAIKAIASGQIKLKNLVTDIFNFDDIQNALQRSLKERDAIVKAAIKVSRD